ncbi:hypothetical protein J4E85_005991 [Alternaria conjuncta]|uniref:uncharacterized protein n=1 Tax=Alternaria conjuncta TaxID=181017 RepID=UPI002220725E|nr:uncharacterized protein J4E85_005991 [Alternaria conjuncta]KAI4927480.1 hypothetical protein J4E85_005991 [Alternaria conjuncta]
MNVLRQARLKDKNDLRVSPTHQSGEPRQLGRSISLATPASAKVETVATSRKNRVSSGGTSKEVDPKKPTKAVLQRDKGPLEPHDEVFSSNPQDVPRFEELLLRAGEEFPMLQSLLDGPTEEEAAKALHRYRELCHSLDAAHRSLDNYRADAGLLDSLKIEVHTLKSTLRASRTEVESLRTEVNSKHQQMLKAQDMLGEQVVIHEQEKRYLEARIHDGSQQQDKENKSTKASSEGQLGAARQEEEQKRYEQKISTLKDQMSEEHWKWDAHLREVKDTYETRIKDLEVSFAERMKNEYEQHCEQTRQEMGKHQVTVNEYQSNVARLKLNAEQEGRLLHEDLQTQREKLREEQKRHEKNLKRQEAGLTKKHTQEILQLQTTLVEQRQELSHLRHVKANADEERLRMRDEVRAKTTQFSEERQRLRELLKKQNAELVEKHALEIVQLRLANEELKQAFIDKAYPQRTKARSVKVMRYRDISTQFFSVNGTCAVKWNGHSPTTNCYASTKSIQGC